MKKEYEERMRRLGIQGAEAILDSGDAILSASLFLEMRQLAADRGDRETACAMLAMMANSYALADDFRAADQCLVQAVKESGGSFTFVYLLASLWHDRAEKLASAADVRASEYFERALGHYRAARAAAETDGDRRAMDEVVQRLAQRLGV